VTRNVGGGGAGGTIGRDDGVMASIPMGHDPYTETPPVGGSGTFQVWSPGDGSRRGGIGGGAERGGGAIGRGGGAIGICGKGAGLVVYPTGGIGRTGAGGGGGMLPKSPSI
jgi:hypothetical protein